MITLHQQISNLYYYSLTLLNYQVRSKNNNQSHV